MSTSPPLTSPERRHFLKALRAARYAALEDAENFTDICFVLEELGLRVHGRKENGLGQYQEALVQFVGEDEDSVFKRNLRRLKDMRNDKMHQGVYARNAVSKAVAVALTLEDRLMKSTVKNDKDTSTIEDVMVEGVVFAQPFMTVAKVRELMLAHSFSFLPLPWKGEYVLIADHDVARFWYATKKGQDNLRYGKLEDLLSGEASILKTHPAQLVHKDKLLGECVESLSYIPWLVEDGDGHIVGIVSAFDWL